MLREIGSDFWNNIEHNNGLEFHIRGIGVCQGRQLYISGRSAIRAFARDVEVRTKKVLIPAFSCGTVIVPFVREGWEIAYYGIHRSLVPNKKNLIECIESFNPSVVFLQNYFGYDTLSGIENVIALCRQKNIVVIEDLTQCLFSAFKKTEADYYVSSFRKFIAIPEGGILLSKHASIEWEIKEAVPQILEVAREAFDIKKKYMEEDFSIQKEVFLEKYRNLKALIAEYSDIYQMNVESKKFLQCIDSQMLIQKRRENYKVLYHELGTVSWLTCIFGIPKSTETPLYFPVYINCSDKREEIQSYLSLENIYCPIVWPRYMRQSEIDNDSNYIYDHILCIPCDQRYGLEEMQRIVQVIKKLEG